MTVGNDNKPVPSEMKLRSIFNERRIHGTYLCMLELFQTAKYYYNWTSIYKINFRYNCKLRKRTHSFSQHMGSGIEPQTSTKLIVQMHVCWLLQI